MALFTYGRLLSESARADAAYLRERKVDTLVSVGAVDEVEARLMGRADEIARGNHNGVSEAGEIAALFEPAIHARLLPAERRALPNLWERYRIQNADFELVELPTVAEIPADPGGSDLRARFQIDALDAPLREVALRVMGGVDPERNPSFIEFGEVIAVLASPEALLGLTPRETSLLRQLEEIMAEEATRPPRAPNLVIPPLGIQYYALPAPADVTIRLAVDTALTLHREQDAQNAGFSVPQWIWPKRHELRYQAKAMPLEINVPPEHRAVLVTEQGEKILQTGERKIPATPGPYLIELYDAQGRKVGDASFTLPEVAADRNLAPDHAGKPIVTTRGAPVFPEHEAFSSWQSGYQQTHDSSSWRMSTLSPMHDPEQAAKARDAFEMPECGLRDGTYVFDLGGQGPDPRRVRLEKYGKCFVAELDGERFWLAPGIPKRPRAQGWDVSHYWEPMVYRAHRNDLELSFDPARSTFELHSWTMDRPGRDARPLRTDAWSHEVVETDRHLG